MNELAKYIVLGNVDAGKSSFVSVMSNGVLDDGNGLARSAIVTNKHEQESGRTSTHKPYYVIRDDQCVTLVDLCGHEKYLKTTMFGLTGMFPDYGLLIIGSNQGITKMTIEYLGLLISNKIPFIVIMNKIDLCPPNVYANTKRHLTKIAKNNRKKLIWHETQQDTQTIDLVIDTIHVVCLSNKTGLNTEWLRNQLFREKAKIVKTTHTSVLFADHLFSVKGVGSVISGTLLYGNMSLHQKLWLGPISGKYVPIVAKSIHNCTSQNVQILKEGQSGSIGIRVGKNDFDRMLFRKGMVITSDVEFVKAHTCWSFEAQVIVFNHSTTIENNYQAVIHCGTVRQCARFTVPCIMRSGSRETVTIQFMYRPEFILPESYFMFRDGHTKGMGKITKLM